MSAPASEGRWRRWRRCDGHPDDDDEPRVVEEEGEIVNGCHSESETDTDEYYNRHSPSECDDEADSGREGATSFVVPANNGGTGLRGWGGTGKRGRPGIAVSPSADEPDHQFMAAVAAAASKPVLQPVPLAFATPNSLPPASVPPMASAARTNNLSGGQTSSAQSVQHDDAVNTVVAATAAAAVPPAEAAVHEQTVALPRRRRPAPAAAGRQNPDGYTCPKCGMWFATHQGLGGHSVGHKHREERQLMMMLAVPGGGRRGGADDAKRRERVHVCGDCGAEFATGVQLGGHKRKHWAGAPIVPKKKPRAVGVVQPLPPPAGPARAADLMLPLPIKTDEMPATATGSPVPGTLRLFGFDIMPAAVPMAQSQQGSPASSAIKSSAGSSSHSP